ncbi:hypothetical protein GOBAR_DD16199 [Gossypium barbadense]|nr:hypothetical protein GOBAR_DD16199 [Gossypium barbadense]
MSTRLQIEDYDLFLMKYSKIITRTKDEITGYVITNRVLLRIAKQTLEVASKLPKWGSTTIRAQEVHSNGPVLNDSLLVDLEVSHAIENEKEVHKTTKIYNTDRAVCGRIAANDYVGNGMAEGEVVVTPTENFGFYPEDATIMEGWRALYCISLAQAMVKGTDDHCCEYMIGGSMVILGKMERNVVV